MDLEKTTLGTKKEAEALQAEEQQQLTEAQILATPEAQKELTVEEVQPDLKPLEKSNLSSSGTESKGTL